MFPRWGFKRLDVQNFDHFYLEKGEIFWKAMQNKSCPE